MEEGSRDGDNYSPDNPSEALLEPADAVDWSTMFVVAGIAMDIGGFAWAILRNRT